jgi:hypothetical protein
MLHVRRHVALATILLSAACSRGAGTSGSSASGSTTAAAAQGSVAQAVVSVPADPIMAAFVGSPVAPEKLTKAMSLASVGATWKMPSHWSVDDYTEGLGGPVMQYKKVYPPNNIGSVHVLLAEPKDSADRFWGGKPFPEVGTIAKDPGGRKWTPYVALVVGDQKLPAVGAFNVDDKETEAVVYLRGKGDKVVLVRVSFRKKIDEATKATLYDVARGVTVKAG